MAPMVVGVCAVEDKESRLHSAMIGYFCAKAVGCILLREGLSEGLPGDLKLTGPRTLRQVYQHGRSITCYHIETR